MQWTEPAEDRSRLLHAVILLSLVSADMSRLAAGTLGRNSMGNREIQVLLLVRAHPGLTPSAVAARTGMRRNALSRTLGHLSEDRLVRLRPHPRDGRSKLLYPTRQADARVDALETAIGDYLVSQSATLQEIITLLTPGVRRGEATPPAGERPSPLGLLGDLAEAGAPYVDEVMTVAPDHGLTSAADRLALLLVRRDGEVRPSRLGEVLHLTSGGATLLLGRLERAGLVSRHRPDDAADRRIVLVTCTPRGDQAVSAILDVFERHTASLVGAFERLQHGVSALSNSA